MADPAFAREVRRGLDADALPDYAPMLAAYHRAHADRLRDIVADLPLRPGDRALDMACGDGAYTLLLAERVGRRGRVLGVDIATAYLAVARRRAAASAWAGSIAFQAGAIEGLPFADDTFDLVWCAQSLYSLPDPISTLHELRRITRPGGAVAILENDTLHHLVFPWPVELEMAVRRAQLRTLQEGAGSIGKFFIGRQLCHAFDLAGLHSCAIRPYTTVRRAPLSADERTFLTRYLSDLRECAWPHLELAARESFDLLINPDSALCLLDRPDFYVVYIDIVACGIKGATGPAGTDCANSAV